MSSARRRSGGASERRGGGGRKVLLTLALVLMQLFCIATFVYAVDGDGGNASTTARLLSFGLSMGASFVTGAIQKKTMK